CLPPGPPPWTLDERGLVLFPAGDFSREEVVPLQNGGAEPAADGQPGLVTDRLLYTTTPISWEEWVRAWEADQAGQAPDLPVLHAVRLLPSPEGSDLPATAGLPVA